MYFLDLLNIGVMIVSSDFKVTYCNKWLKRRFINIDHVKVGYSLLDLMDTKNKRLKEAIVEASQSSKSYHLSDKLNELPFILKTNDTYLNYNLCITPLTSGPSKEKSVLLQFLDITPIKRRETYLKKKQEELEQQQKLNFSQERMSSLGELTSSIAHEINNPLAMLNLGNSMLKRVVEKDEINKEQLLDIIEDNNITIKRISEMISGIQHLSRKPNKGEFKLIKLSTIIQDILPVFSGLLKSNNINLIVDYNDDILNKEIPLSKELISQVFMNLFKNAIYEIRSKEHESPFIKISGTIDSETAVLNFTDSGDGIPQEVSDKIFLPFYTTKDFGEGTGLGLSTVHRIMNNHNGDISIDTENPNTSFVLSFPITTTDNT
jgi:signal transduction histidine kinase